MMKIRIRKSAIKDLTQISPEQKKKIHLKILALKNFSDVTNIKKLTSFEPAYRLCIGDYRVLLDVIDDCIEIDRVLHRKESYK
ncbi:MAG: type II toxin-antitoxin system RelE/ParE family toxin [Prolixibacteraceae bacterium]|nr:type II toxin-antitoxin system RelE/ParE family toxin [Prolixibacteraceae bacterium]